MSRAERLRIKLESHYHPLQMELQDESYKHRGAPGAESHFVLKMVAEAFQGLGRLERQQQVLRLVSEEFANGLHALSMRLLSPVEWENTPEKWQGQSPPCAGARKN